MSFPPTLRTDAVEVGPPKGNLSLSYLVKHWMRQSYDEAGPLLLGGFYFLLVTFAAFAPTALSGQDVEGESGISLPHGALQAGFALFGIWIVMTGWLALNRYIEQILTFQYPGWLAYWVSFPRFLLTSLWLVLFFGAGFGVLAFDFLTYPQMLASMPYVRLLAISVTLWMVLLLAMVEVHLVPFLVHQNRPFWTALKRAALVAVWKPLRTLLLLGIEVFFVLVCLRTPPLIFILPGAFAVLANLSLLILLDEWRDPYEKTPEAIRAGA
jgi:uncharacterized membrane protein YesL